MAGEAKLEKKCRDYAKARGVENFKFRFVGHRGGKDVIFFPGNGRVFFVEFKNPNKKGRVHWLQNYVHELLREKDVPVYIIDDYENFEEICDDELRRFGQ